MRHRIKVRTPLLILLRILLQFKPRRMEAARHKHLILRWPILHAPCCAVSGAAACEQWDAIIALCAHSQLAYYRVWNICRYSVLSGFAPGADVMPLFLCVRHCLIFTIPFCKWICARERLHCSLRAGIWCVWFENLIFAFRLSPRHSRQQACQAYT